MFLRAPLGLERLIIAVYCQTRIVEQTSRVKMKRELLINPAHPTGAVAGDSGWRRLQVGGFWLHRDDFIDQ